MLTWLMKHLLHYITIRDAITKVAPFVLGIPSATFRSWTGWIYGYFCDDIFVKKQGGSFVHYDYIWQTSAVDYVG